MKAVILAAGIASRLRPLTDTTPKCLLKVGERCLLQRAFDALLQNGFRLSLSPVIDSSRL